MRQGTSAQICSVESQSLDRADDYVQTDLDLFGPENPIDDLIRAEYEPKLLAFRFAD
jgi:hypothetical protein